MCIYLTVSRNLKWFTSLRSAWSMYLKTNNLQIFFFVYFTDAQLNEVYLCWILLPQLIVIFPPHICYFRLMYWQCLYFKIYSHGVKCWKYSIIQVSLLVKLVTSKLSTFTFAIYRSSSCPWCFSMTRFVSAIITAGMAKEITFDVIYHIMLHF